LIAGSIRGIPFFWQLLDCSFGLIGGLLLFLLYRKIRQLERMFQAGQLMVRRTPEQ
jgi:hypothetical protein